MRPTTSFAGLVTLMAVASTTAAPIRVDLGSGHAVSRVGNHQLGRSVLAASQSKASIRIHLLPNQTYPNACQCTPVSAEDVKPITGGADAKAKNVGQTVQDEIYVPDTHAHVDADGNKGGDKIIGLQLQPQQQPSHEPEGHNGACLDPTKVDGSLQANNCVTTGLKDGIGAIYNDAHMTEHQVKATADAALDHVYSVGDKSMNVVHDAEKGAHIVQNLKHGGSDALKSVGASREPAAAKVDVEGVDLIKGICVNFVAKPSV